jgi:4-hydroxy-4-methyl-2-oxoglutarate aldolase
MGGARNGAPPTSQNKGRYQVKKILVTMLLGCTALAIVPATAQVKQTREQILFYTGDWKGERFPDGRPKVSADLLKRAADCTIEDVWGFLRQKGYRNQYEGGWMMLHNDRPFAGRALTVQYMPERPDMNAAITAEGKTEGRVSGHNSWPIAELQEGDVYIADGYGKQVEGTLIGSNLGNGIYGKSHTGFVFDAAIRDQEENKEIKGFNGFYRSIDPSAIRDMEMTAINAPIRIGRATVLPGDVVLAKEDGVLIIPAALAEDAISTAEFIGLTDDYNFQLNLANKNGGAVEGGWDDKKFAGFKEYIAKNPKKVRMSKEEFDKMYSQFYDRTMHPRSGQGGL